MLLPMEHRDPPDSLLSQELPRRRKVNLRPVGSSEGQLMAWVTPIGTELDLSTGLIAAGLALNSCGVDG